MIVTNLRFTTDLERGLVMTPLANAFMSGDDEAHKFVVSCYSGLTRAAFDLTGAVVTGYFVRADGSTVIVEGDVSSNAANVLLPAECYAVPGRFSLVIKAARGSSVHSLLWAQGAVSRSHTDAVLDPGQVLPSLDELMAQIGLLEQTTTAAQAVANMTAEATTLPAGSAATASYANGKLSLGIPKGQDSDTALPTGYEPYNMLVIGPDGKPRWEERTHYDYGGTVLPLTDLKVLGGHHTFDAPLDTMPVVGVPYRVTYQGTEYTVTAKSYVDEGKDCVTLGNQWDLGVSGENTKEPFVILLYPPETVTNNYYGFLSCDATSASTVSLGIEGEGELKKIDPKYLPEGTGTGGGSLPTGGEPYKQLVTDGEGNAVWEDRLAYESAGLVEVLQETEMEPSEDGMFGTLTPYTNTFAVGDVCIVTWNGVEYRCTAQALDDGELTTSALGNVGFLSGDDDTGEPFVILDWTALGEGSATVVAFALDGATSVTLSIYADGTVVHAVPQKYLPEYIYGELPYIDRVFADFSMEFEGSSGYIPTPFKHPIVAGQTYTVIYNGTEYECTAFENNGVITVGSTRENSEYPFRIDYNPQLNGYVKVYDGATSCEITIVGSGADIRKIPGKFLNVIEPYFIDVVADVQGEASNNRTFDEVMSAYEAGQVLICCWQQYETSSGYEKFYLPLVGYSSYADTFTFELKYDNLPGGFAGGIIVKISRQSTTVAKSEYVPNEIKIKNFDGTKTFKITVSDDGTLTTTEV